jgi:hypothetical protein
MGRKGESWRGRWWVDAARTRYREGRMNERLTRFNPLGFGDTLLVFAIFDPFFVSLILLKEIA